MTQPLTEKMFIAAEKSKFSECRSTGAPAAMGIPASVAPEAVTVGVQPQKASPEINVKTRPFRVAGTFNRCVEGIDVVRPADMVSLGIMIRDKDMYIFQESSARDRSTL